MGFRLGWGRLLATRPHTFRAGFVGGNGLFVESAVAVVMVRKQGLEMLRDGRLGSVEERRGWAVVEVSAASIMVQDGSSSCDIR